MRALHSVPNGLEKRLRVCTEMAPKGFQLVRRWTEPSALQERVRRFPDTKQPGRVLLREAVLEPPEFESKHVVLHEYWRVLFRMSKDYDVANRNLHRIKTRGLAPYFFYEF